MVKRTERGWVGHFILGHRCLFRRNTLLEHNDTNIVISTVGNLMKKDEPISGIEEIGIGRYYETMAFHAKLNDEYKDADVSRQITFAAAWNLEEPGLDKEANNMHETVVDEIIRRLKAGDKFNQAT